MNAAQLQAAIMAGRLDLGPGEVERLRSAWTRQERAAAAFVYWYSTAGHWLHETRAAAVETWRRWGIIGRPDYSEAAAAILAPWVDADPAPALLARLKAAPR